MPKAQRWFVIPRLILFGPRGRQKDASIDRLIGQSLLGDGSFALAFLENLFYPVMPFLVECLAAAYEAGGHRRAGGARRIPMRPLSSPHWDDRFVSTARAARTPENGPRSPGSRSAPLCLSGDRLDTIRQAQAQWATMNWVRSAGVAVNLGLDFAALFTLRGPRFAPRPLPA
ncbi:MAG TPA: hypothetical protein VHE55_17670 [Fimbriimonadaceae bacterium]|nr:hypothetical protein [Fimbriimonadaceae bacterium]